MAKLADPIRTLVSPEGKVFNSIQEFNQDKTQKRELFANQMFPRGRQYNGTPDAVGHGLMREQPNAATLGMAFFNYDKDVVAKSRVPKWMSGLFAEASLEGMYYESEVWLDYVRLRTIWTIPDGGKARKEVLLPIEYMLKFLQGEGIKMKSKKENTEVIG